MSISSFNLSSLFAIALCSVPVYAQATNPSGPQGYHGDVLYYGTATGQIANPAGNLSVLREVKPDEGEYEHDDSDQSDKNE